MAYFLGKRHILIFFFSYPFVEIYMIKSVTEALQKMLYFYFKELQRKFFILGLISNFFFHHLRAFFLRVFRAQFFLENRQPFESSHKSIISSMTLVLLEYMTFGPIFDEAISVDFSVLLYTFICYDKVRRTTSKKKKSKTVGFTKKKMRRQDFFLRDELRSFF